jgi:hypothetical protein
MDSPRRLALDAPVKLVVDCAAYGAKAYFDDAAEWDARADAARLAGDDELVAHCAYAADGCRVAGRNGLAAAGLPDADTVEPEAYVPLTDAELEQRAADASAGVDLAWSMLRADRNARLAASDWTVLPGAPLSTEARDAWTRYRQELRDLTETTVNPMDPEWPQDPNAPQHPGE